MFETERLRAWRVLREPDWAYSWGLWSAYGHPEVAIFGLPPQRWGLVNVVGELVSSGSRLRPGALIDDVLVGSRVAVRRIDPSWHDRFFRTGGSPEFLQVVWPDADGVFPWERGGPAALRPHLWLPAGDHASAQWRAVAGSWRS